MSIIWKYTKNNSLSLIFLATPQWKSCKVYFVTQQLTHRGAHCLSTQIIFPHLSSTVFGIVIVCAISAVILLILWVLLTGWRSCNQHREDGLQDGVQQLLLQHRLQSGGKNEDFLLKLAHTACYQPEKTSIKLLYFICMQSKNVLCTEICKVIKETRTYLFPMKYASYFICNTYNSKKNNCSNYPCIKLWLMGDFTLLFSLMRKAIQESAFTRRESLSAVSLPTWHWYWTYVVRILMYDPSNTQIANIICQFRNENEIQYTKVKTEFRHSAPTSKQKRTMSVTWGTMIDTSLSMSSLNTSMASLAWSCADTDKPNNLTGLIYPYP